nr:hypothetical protein CFP56_51154 [Quercus suber]
MLVCACLNHIPNQLSVDSEKMVAVEKVVMNMDFGYGFKADDNNNNFVTPQEVDRPPLVEMSTNKHEEDRDGEALLPDRCDAVDLGNSSNHQGVELTQSERDMQVDKGGDMSNHLL